MNKEHLHKTMLSLTEDALLHAKQGYADFLQSARIDRSDAVSAQDVSQASQASTLAEAFDQPIHSNTDKLAKLAELEFGTKTTVEEGAVVQFNGRYFVIAVSTKMFECEGKEFMGISTGAPIYKAMEGLQEGDEFSFGSQQFTVEKIF